MDIAQDSLQAEVPTSDEDQDEFVSGPPNRLRLGAVRLMGWLFRPPAFPGGLTWLLMALIASVVAMKFLPQPSSYWTDPGTSSFNTFLGTPFGWGLWNIAVFTGYMLVIALILLMVNIKLAFFVWISLGIHHLVLFTQSFRCGALYYFPFENAGNCAAIHSGMVLLAGILWGGLVFIAARLGLVPFISWEQPETAYAHPWNRSLPRLSLIWISIWALAVIVTAAFAPRPAWQVIETAHAPAARTEASLVYDTKRSVAVLFGGTDKWTQEDGWRSVGDTWEWNGQDWVQLQPEHSPSPRYGAGMAFDEKRGVTVLFGGMLQISLHQNNFFGDTWEWDGQDWKEISPTTSPPGRQGQLMFFDPVRGTVVIYGGYYVDESQTNVFLDDAWEWVGGTWRQLLFDETRRSSGAGIVYDPIRQLPMLMDGEGLWIWQESRWTQLGFPASPSNRWGTELVYDPNAENIVLFGGAMDQNVFDDTWAYNGQTWQQVITKVQPPRRGGHNMFYDQTRDRVVLFGGLDGGTLYNDLWELMQP
jgi:hypothetical protein